MPTPPTLPSGRRPYLAGGVAYSIARKDVLLDGHGQVQGMHWVDEGMAMSMGVRQGTCKAAPEMGNSLHEIVYLGGENLAEQVRAKVLSANPLARLVENGDATIKSIRHNISNSRLEVFIEYVNERAESVRDSESHGVRLEWYSNA